MCMNISGEIFFSSCETERFFFSCVKPSKKKKTSLEYIYILCKAHLSYCFCNTH